MSNFEEFKRFVRQEVDPQTINLTVNDRDKVRNLILYAKNEQELIENCLKIYTDYKIRVKLEELKKKFEPKIKEEPLQEDRWNKTKSVYSSGKLNDNLFFNVIFIMENDIFTPKLCLSNGEILEIEETLRDNDLEQYFIFKDIKYKFMNELFFKDSYKINTVDDKVIELIKNKFSDKGIYNKLIEELKEFWDHYNEYEYDIINSFIIQTPILRLIGKTFYLVLNGKEDTGKSTLQKLITNLQFNGIFGGKGSIPVSVRLIHCLGINLNQDEFEKLNKDEKKNLVGVFNSGLYKDGTYSFVNTNKRRIREQITILSTFSAKSFSCNYLGDFDKTFLSRVYELICVRQNRKLNDIHDLSVKDIEEFQTLTNELFAYCIINSFEIQKDIYFVKKELEDEGVFGRKTDINSIILGIIKHFKGNYYLEVKEHLKQKAGILEEENSGTYESIIFEYLSDKFLPESRILEVSNKEILSELCKQLEIDTKDEKAPKGKTIGTILKNHGLIRKPENLKRKSKGVIYFLNKSDFLDMAKRYGYNKILDKHATFGSQDSLDAQKNEENEPNEDNVEPKEERDPLGLL